MTSVRKVRAHSTISVKGQTVVPREVREALGIEAGTNLSWVVEDGVAHVRPLPADPIAAAIGALKHTNISTAALLEDRRKDRDKEEAETERQLTKWRSTS